MVLAKIAYGYNEYELWNNEELISNSHGVTRHWSKIQEEQALKFNQVSVLPFQGCGTDGGATNRRAWEYYRCLDNRV
jgi:hypothetical protein